MARYRGFGGLSQRQLGTIAPKTAAATTMPDVAYVAGVVILALVADRRGRIIGEIRPQVLGVAWKLNDYGRARMVLSKSLDGLEDLIRSGNRLLLRFDNGLPAWGGVIDYPRKWGDGVEVEAYSGEYLLSWRTTDASRSFDRQPAGHIFRALIQEANGLADMGIDVGQVWIGGEPHSPDYHFRDLLDIAQKSLTARLEDADFEVRPYVERGRIRFRANFYERRGTYKRHVFLIQGLNLSGIQYNEQGPIVNSWHMTGGGSGWAENRLMSHASDEESIDEFGLREGSKAFPDVTVQATLDRHVELELAESKQHHPVVSGNTFNRSPAEWQDYGVGDSVNLRLLDYGFRGYEAVVRIVAREFLPAEGVCAEVIE